MTTAKTITYNIAQNIDTQKILFRIILMSLVALLTVYLYLIGSITFNVVARKSLENTVKSLSTNVNELDLAYLNGVNKIDKEYALSLGFVDTHQNIFASRSINRVAMR